MVPYMHDLQVGHHFYDWNTLSILLTSTFPIFSGYSVTTLRIILVKPTDFQ